MTREAIIQKAVSSLSKLPQSKVEEVIDFAEFLLQKQENTEIQEIIYSTVSDQDVFDFLREEEDIYHLSDAKELY
ncbi:DUF2281 domain-containing protein [Proteiniphilum sp.]|uniref:DUF2281 domain-containing protein n=1 Tax=Proteiniphilum sp. TaxID=1926877 RepID=UPI003316CEF0